MQKRARLTTIWESSAVCLHHSTSFYTLVSHVTGRVEDEIGRLKATFGVLNNHFNIRNDKFEVFYDVIGLCMALHNLKRFYLPNGQRRPTTPAWLPACAEEVRIFIFA